VTLPLRCTVRDCFRPLVLQESGALACAEGHSFDRAREGYWNLLQPQDRRSEDPGDRHEALAARRRWLANGFADGLIETLRGTVSSLDLRGAPTIDVGCGEGTIATRIGARHLCGVDLSTSAVRMAARLDPKASWIVANADRGLPFEDASIGLAMSIFGRRPVAELARVLRPDGYALIVVPGPEDLVELREATKGRGVLRERAPEVIAELSSFARPLSTQRWTHRARHDRKALEDALTMSYRGERLPERRRLAGLESLDVTLSADVLVLCHNSRP
jgi:23S rRNA (guanine745-N1)-methyltransferase